MSPVVPALTLAALYVVFLWWSVGRGGPMGAQEIEAGLRDLANAAGNGHAARRLSTNTSVSLRKTDSRSSDRCRPPCRDLT